MNPSDFLSLVWGADNQGNLADVHFIGEKTPTKMIHHPATTVAQAIAQATRIKAVRRDAYFACATFKTAADRTGENAAGAYAFWVDLDCSAEKAAKSEGYLTKHDAIVALRDFCKATGLPKPTIIVDSGNGLHCYWPFVDFIGADEWRKLARKLKRLAAKHGLRADPSRTADVASVLRVPSTKNFKDPTNPKPVTTLHGGNAVDFKTFADALQRGEPGLPSNLTMGGDSRGRFPPSSAYEIAKHCPTLAHFAQVRGAVSEPFWRTSLGVLKYATEGAAICHEWSKGDPRYNKDQTQAKIDRWTKGPAFCESFRAMSDSKCQGCKQTCKSPIQLGFSKDLEPLEAALHEMNLRHFVAKIGGGVFVFDEHDESPLTKAMTFTAFRQFKAGHLVDGRKVPDIWLTSPLRRTFDALVFDPSGKASATAFNTWQGLAIEPKRGDCKLILRHIRDVWCNGDLPQLCYVLRWMALLVQKPWIKPEVALVLCSKEGAGKNVIVHMLLRMLGVHGFITAQKDQVAGRFNGHLFDKVLVVLDEAFFAGDPAAVAAAKALVTNSPLGYEAKNKDAFSAPNFAHVISMTNNEWAVPAGEDSRRWMVLALSEARRGDHTYFNALAAEIKHGGAEAFLDFLLRVPLGAYDPRALPRSGALHAQQVETLTRRDPVAGWWLHVLSEGSFPSNGYSTDWGAELPTIVLHDSYTQFTARFRGGAPVWDVAAKRLRDLLPSSGLPKSRKGQGVARSLVYALPDLDQARKDFEAVTKIDPCSI